jgi:hypothetical protein
LGLGPIRLDAVLERGRVLHGDQSLQRETENVVNRLAAKGRPVSRRNVVQAWCMELPDGGRADKIERAAERLLDSMVRDPRRGIASDDMSVHGPGVTERSLPLDSLELGPTGRRFAEQAIEQRLAIRRELSREPDLARTNSRGMSLELGRSRGLGQDTGLGFG